MDHGTIRSSAPEPPEMGAGWPCEANDEDQSVPAGSRDPRDLTDSGDSRDSGMLLTMVFECFLSFLI